MHDLIFAPSTKHLFLFSRTLRECVLYIYHLSVVSAILFQDKWLDQNWPGLWDGVAQSLDGEPEVEEHDDEDQERNCYLCHDDNKPEREEQGADEHDQVQHLDGKPELDVVLPLLFDAHFQKVVGDEAEDAAGDPQAQEDVDGCPLVGVDGEVVAEQGQAH